MNLCVVLLGLLGAALNPEADREFQAVLARYRKVKTLSGNFEQTICSDVTGYCQRLAGQFFLAQPNRYRFEVTEPERQTIVGDSALTWFYWPDSNYVRKTQAVASPFFEILLNSSNQTFTAEEVTLAGDRVVLGLVPTDSLTYFTKLRLSVAARDHEIREIIVDDGAGTELRYVLDKVTFNPRLDPRRFSFVPPPGAVVEE